MTDTRVEHPAAPEGAPVEPREPHMVDPDHFQCDQCGRVTGMIESHDTPTGLRLYLCGWCHPANRPTPAPAPDAGAGSAPRSGEVDALYDEEAFLDVLVEYGVACANVRDERWADMREGYAEDARTAREHILTILRALAARAREGEVGDA